MGYVSLPFHVSAISKLKQAGFFTGKMYARCQRNSIRKLSDLSHLLWKVLCVYNLNKWGDFSYCHLGTLNFYLLRVRPVTEISFDGQTEGGFVVLFSCVWMNTGGGKENLDELFPAFSNE